VSSAEVWLVLTPVGRFTKKAILLFALRMIAGFTRDHLEGQPYATEISRTFRVEKIVRELL
jgi:hypothetical protein